MERITINETGLFGDTLLIRAVLIGNLESLKELIKAGADINRECNDETALMVAARRGYLEIVKELINAGANVNHSNEYASEYGYTDCAELLLIKH